MAGKKKKKLVRPAYAPKKKESKPLTKEQKLGILIGVGVLVLAIVLFALLYDDGSLKVKNGEIVGAQENWIVADLSQSSSRHKYYKLGEVEPLEGFTEDTESTLQTSSNLTTVFAAKPNDENAAISSYYVTGVARKADEMIAEVHERFPQWGYECGDITTLTLDDGTEMPYFISSYTPAEGQDGYASQSVCAYIPAQHSASVLISLSNNLTEGREALSDEAVEQWLKAIAGTITVETPKK